MIYLLLSELQARVNAVEEIIDDDSGRVERLRSLLKGLPDLPKGLVRIQYGRVRCSPHVLSRSQGPADYWSLFYAPVNTCGAYIDPRQPQTRCPLLPDLTRGALSLSSSQQHY